MLHNSAGGNCLREKKATHYDVMRIISTQIRWQD